MTTPHKARMLGNTTRSRRFPYDPCITHNWAQPLKHAQRSRENQAIARDIRHEEPEPEHDEYCRDELDVCYGGMCDCHCHGNGQHTYWKLLWQRGLDEDAGLAATPIQYQGKYTTMTANCPNCDHIHHNTTRCTGTNTDEHGTYQCRCPNSNPVVVGALTFQREDGTSYGEVFLRTGLKVGVHVTAKGPVFFIAADPGHDLSHIPIYINDLCIHGDPQPGWGQ